MQPPPLRRPPPSPPPPRAEGPWAGPPLPAVSAVAVGSLWSNAVGTVALRCLPDRLHIDLLRVGRFRAGFALVGAASQVSFEVPYRAVRALVRSGPVLGLVLDPRVARPYHRFALCRFSDGPHESLLGAFRLSVALRLARVVLPAVVAVAAWWWVPEAWVAGLVGRAAAALLLGWLGWALAGPLVGLGVGGGPRSRLLRARFEQALCERLGLEPASGLAARAGEERQEPLLGAPLASDGVGEPRPALRAAWGVVARPRALAVVCGLGLLASLGAVVAVQRFGVVQTVLLPVDDGRVGLRDVVRGRAEEASTAVVAQRGACRCERTASALWQGGVPLLSIVVAPRRGSIDSLWLRPGETVAIGLPAGRTAEPVPGEEAGAGRKTEPSAEGERPRRRKRRRTQSPAPEVELDIAVINNGARALENVSLVVTFAQRSAQGARMAVMERGLAWPRPLGPAEAVKWRVEAEGTELRIDCRFDEMLGLHPVATAEQFRGLLDARLTPVRVHAAMMLAYLGDPRARETAVALGPLPPREEQVRAEIVRTQASLRACALEGETGSVALCVHNGSSELLRAVTVTPAGLGRAGGEPAWTVQDFFRPGTALRVQAPAGVTPGGFDVRPAQATGAPQEGAMVPVEP